jgi:adenylate cyclase
MSPPAAQRGTFDEHLALEIAQSERLRMALLAGAVAALILLFGAMFALYRETYQQHIGSPRAFMHSLVILLVLVAYELGVRHMIGLWLRWRGSVPTPLRYLNAFIETSVPTILMIAVARHANPLHVLQGAASVLYGVFIVLSTLRLDFRLSAFTGAVAAIEYAVLCHYYLASGELSAGTPFGEPPFYLAKSAMLLVAGLAAGFVADQLKRRARNAFRAQEERQRIVAAFGQQVSHEIVEELLKRGPTTESRRAFVCVMFMDIRGFTPLVEKKSPEEIVALQNEVFGAAVEAVNRHHGIINQFLGDGFMATFGAPLATGEDCRNALAAARELLARVAELSASGRIPPTQIGIGLHAGEAVTGNIGSAQRKQYSITGNVVILAARIEQLNKEYGSQLLASGEVLRAGGDQVAGAVPLGSVQVKGRNEPIEIYRLA